MSRLQGWLDWVSQTEDAVSLALFRIFMGSGAFLTVFTTVWAGLVPVLWHDREDGGILELGDGGWFLSLFGGPTPTVVWSTVVASLVLCVLMTLGIGGRVVMLLALFTTDAVTSLNGHAGGSYDQLLSNGMWLCVLGGGAQTLSVPAKLRTGLWAPSVQVVAFPRWLAAYQLVLMYCMTGIQKVSAYWVPGGDASALYYILQQPSWHRFDMSFMAWLFPLTQLSTLVTWFWEVFSPLWLLAVWWSTRPETRTGVAAWSNRVGVRWWFFGVGVAMHILIFFTMNVGPFTYLSLGFYAVMVHPEEWRQFARWVPAQLRERGWLERFSHS